MTVVVLSLAAVLLQSAAPSRDRRPAETGTAAIRGRIFAGDTGKPLRRARVRLLPSAGETRVTSSDADGRYEFTDLAAGQYTMQVDRSGYLQLRYGQRRPLEQGKPLQLADRQVVDNADFSMPRMSVITGRITDEAGDPLEGVLVVALRSRFWEGHRQLVPTGRDIMRTDDAGQYRLLGLAPGSYYVMATTRETWTLNQGGVRTVMGYAPTYFPGTANVENARRVTVALGREAINNDFSMAMGRTASISGTAFDSRGKPFPRVQLSEEIRGEDFARFGGAKNATVAADGTFTIKDVTPGDYKLVSATERGAEHPEIAILPITIDSVDITGAALNGSAGGFITGRIISETGEPPPTSRMRLAIGIPATGQPDPMLLGTFGDPGTSQVTVDGLFSIKGVFGRSRLRVTVPDGWMLRSITHDGRDLSDSPIELRSGETLSNVEIVVTNRISSVEGALTDDRDRPVTEGTIVLFAEDAAHWAADSRRLRAVRPNQQGRFQVKGLPAGDYLAVALDYVEDGMWNDPEFLESLRRYATKVSVADAANQTITLKVIAQP